ncbi:MAG: Grx4 family monothiol glutaredoxin [Acidobacteria bacterium]|nr:MAG: Grx4 family monothiol glutaredoxin [Acidobacteriota bacterium]REJ99660.1 MAG: Grx4 family monothiol glutaredoxin [Acidobacteriota bacterium]
MTEAVSEVHQRIQKIVEGAPVVLFMKGNRDQPQCGFSAQVVQVLDRVLPQYVTVDVLADADIRSGIKEYSDWPTIPQLYVRGEFQGGCDIVREMYGNGELHQALGLEKPGAGEPSISVSDEALEMLREAQQQYGGEPLHLGIDARFRASLGFGPASGEEVAVVTSGFTILLDPDSAARADGLEIGVGSSPSGGRGLTLNNPNQPKVAQMSVAELDQLRRSGVAHHLVDVRTDEERAKAKIDGAVPFSEFEAGLAELDRDAKIVLHCHHGGRSQRAAEQLAAQGFTDVHNLAGGIDAWSREIDASVPKY